MCLHFYAKQRYGKLKLKKYQVKTFFLESDAGMHRDKYLLHQHPFWRTLPHLIYICQSARRVVIRLMVSPLSLATHLTVLHKRVPRRLTRRCSTQAGFCNYEHKGFLHHVQTLIFLSCGTFSFSPMGTCQSPTGSWKTQCGIWSSTLTQPWF